MSKVVGPFETFRTRSAAGGGARITLRVPEIDVKADRNVALLRLDDAHSVARARLGLASRRFIFAEQVHGSRVAIVDALTSGPVPGMDGLITADAAVCLGVYTADCGAVFLVDPRRRVIGLLHSGRKGTELGITLMRSSR